MMRMCESRKSEVILEYCGMSLIPFRRSLTSLLSACERATRWQLALSSFATCQAECQIHQSLRSFLTFSEQHAIESRMQMALMSLWWHTMQPSVHVRRAASGELQLSFFIKNGQRGGGKGIGFEGIFFV